MLECPFIGNSSETYNTTRRETFIICEAFRCPRTKLDFNTHPFIEKSSTEVAFTFSARVAMKHKRFFLFLIVHFQAIPLLSVDRWPHLPFPGPFERKNLKRIFFDSSKLSIKPGWVVKASEMVGNLCGQMNECQSLQNVPIKIPKALKIIFPKMILKYPIHSRTCQAKIRGSCEVCRKTREKFQRKQSPRNETFPLNINSLLNAKLADVAIKQTRGGTLRVIQT